MGQREEEDQSFQLQAILTAVLGNFSEQVTPWRSWDSPVFRMQNLGLNVTREEMNYSK